MSKKRKVHIDGNEWAYVIGSTFINIWHPVTKKRINVGFDKILGRSWTAIERLQYKNPGCEELEIGPGKIKAYIEENLHEKPKSKKKLTRQDLINLSK